MGNGILCSVTTVTWCFPMSVRKVLWWTFLENVNSGMWTKHGKQTQTSLLCYNKKIPMFLWIGDEMFLWKGWFLVIFEWHKCTDTELTSLLWGKLFVFGFRSDELWTKALYKQWSLHRWYFSWRVHLHLCWGLHWSSLQVSDRWVWSQPMPKQC